MVWAASGPPGARGGGGGGGGLLALMRLPDSQDLYHVFKGGGTYLNKAAALSYSLGWLKSRFYHTEATLFIMMDVTASCFIGRATSVKSNALERNFASLGGPPAAEIRDHVGSTCVVATEGAI